MKKLNPTRYSSAVGEIWVMATFKVKYCHEIFDNKGIREVCDSLFNQAFDYYKIDCQKLAFDSDHVHMILDMGLYSKVEIAKKIERLCWQKVIGTIADCKKTIFLGVRFMESSL